jgi:hypothetical protein
VDHGAIEQDRVQSDVVQGFLEPTVEAGVMDDESKKAIERSVQTVRHIAMFVLNRPSSQRELALWKIETAYRDSMKLHGAAPQFADRWIVATMAEIRRTLAESEKSGGGTGTTK